MIGGGDGKDPVSKRHQLDRGTVVYQSSSFIFLKFCKISKKILKFQELKKKIEDNGGKVAGSISGKTAYVVAGKNMGPSKQEKAKKLNVPIISVADLLAMLHTE